MKGNPTRNTPPTTFPAVLKSRLCTASPTVKVPPPNIAIANVPMLAIECSKTAGAGVEWAFAENWTAKVEYLYVDLGNANATCSTAFCTGNNGGAPVPVNVSLTENLVRAGVNYKFQLAEMRTQIIWPRAMCPGGLK